MEPKIIYEDNHVIVVIKPHNVAVQEDESKDEDMLTIIKNFIKKRDAKQGNVFLQNLLSNQWLIQIKSKLNSTHTHSSYH